MMGVAQPSRIDRLITAIAPGYGVRRYQARLALGIAGQYAGARSNRASMKSWQTSPGSADSDSLGDLPVLRSRSRDLIRNNPIAGGALATSRSHVIGTGLRLRADIDRDFLGLSKDQAEKWERRVEKLFDMWAFSPNADITLTQDFYALQGLVFSTVFESGDALILRRRAKRGLVPLALAIVEADRIATPPTLESDDSIRSGVQQDRDGAPVAYFVSNDHPGDYVLNAVDGYRRVRAFGEESGERMALHVFRRLRPGQTRGVPELAPIIEILKQLDRYTEAELMSAVVSSFFTVFMKTNDESGLRGASSPVPGLAADEIAMGPGAIVNVDTSEDIQIANPARANSNFDAFFSAMVRQIGVALSIPYELLIMHFTASYSASRAALEMAAQFFKERREWLISTLCQPVYEWFLTEAILAGLVEAPGFFDDPVKRASWLGTEWIPPSRLVIDPKKEWEAEEAAIAIGAKTLEEVTLEKTGGDWRQKTEQRAREHKLRAEAGLEPEILSRDGAGSPAPSDDEDQDADGKFKKRKPKDADS